MKTSKDLKTSGAGALLIFSLFLGSISVFAQISDRELVSRGILGQLGGCRVVDATHDRSWACDLYVLGIFKGTHGYFGYPKDPSSGDSTGCVVAPSLPKHMVICWPGYSPDMCTLDTISNVAAQLRRALQDGACGIRVAAPDPKSKDQTNVSEILLGQMNRKTSSPVNQSARGSEVQKVWGQIDRKVWGQVVSISRNWELISLSRPPQKPTPQRKPDPIPPDPMPNDITSDSETDPLESPPPKNVSEPKTERGLASAPIQPPRNTPNPIEKTVINSINQQTLP